MSMVSLPLISILYGLEKSFRGSCVNVYILMPSKFIVLQIEQVTQSIKLKQSILLVERPVVLDRDFLSAFSLRG